MLFDGKLEERFFNTYKFFNHVNNVYFIVEKRSFYFWIYGWLAKIQWVIITWKKDLCSYLNIEDITDADYDHTKRVYKDFETKKIGEYHDLYLQSDTLLLADVFDKIRNMCLKIYKLDLSHFLWASKKIIKNE